MAKIAPLRAVRYNKNIVEMEEVVTPPYDVIDVHAQTAFLQKNPYSMIKLDLTKNVAAGEMTEERYSQAKDTFEKWQDDNILVRDQKPAFYLYYTDYTLASGKKFTRKGLICLSGLYEFTDGIVKPHEQIFRGVVTDRVRLLDTCQAHFSPIFALYEDETKVIIETLEGACPDEPLCSVSDQDGCRHTIWAIDDSNAVEKVSSLFKDKCLYIADGHHRYNTALQLRELITERQGEVAPDSPYDFTMMYLCGMDDPGLSVLPTHRLVRIPYAIDLDDITGKMGEYFEVEEISGGSREFLVAEVLARMDECNHGTTFGFYHPGEDRCFLLSLLAGAVEKNNSVDRPEILQKLDVVVLSDLIVEGVLDLDHDRCESENLIDYYSDPDEALDVAVKEDTDSHTTTPVLFLMNSTLVEQVKKVADESLIMPHKSTYFYPKVLTGLVINKIVPTEKIG
jgi:uncharacterized protein (DUF1015 family)